MVFISVCYHATIMCKVHWKRISSSYINTSVSLFVEFLYFALYCKENFEE